MHVDFKFIWKTQSGPTVSITIILIQDMTGKFKVSFLKDNRLESKTFKIFTSK